MNKKIEELIYECLKEIIPEEVLEKLTLEKDKFRIFSNIDSLDMVSFLIDLEAKIQDSLGLTIHITDDRAMSHRGPFVSVASLVDFILILINEEEDKQ